MDLGLKTALLFVSSPLCNADTQRFWAKKVFSSDALWMIRLTYDLHCPLLHNWTSKFHTFTAIFHFLFSPTNINVVWSHSKSEDDVKQKRNDKTLIQLHWSYFIDLFQIYQEGCQTQCSLFKILQACLILIFTSKGKSHSRSKIKGLSCVSYAAGASLDPHGLIQHQPVHNTPCWDLMSTESWSAEIHILQPAAGQCTGWHTAAADCQKPFWKWMCWLPSVPLGIFPSSSDVLSFCTTGTWEGVSAFPWLLCSHVAAPCSNGQALASAKQAVFGASSSGWPFLLCWLSQTPSSHTPQMAN